MALESLYMHVPFLWLLIRTANVTMKMKQRAIAIRTAIASTANMAIIILVVLVSVSFCDPAFFYSVSCSYLFNMQESQPKPTTWKYIPAGDPIKILTVSGHVLHLSPVTAMLFKTMNVLTSL